MSSNEWPGEEIEYLEEVLREYEKYVENIGENGLAAPLLLYYRDEAQETLMDLQGRAPLESYWAQLVALDQKLQEKKENLIAEIGWNHYKTQREAKKPPKAYWWWYLDSTLKEPEKPNPVKSWWSWLRTP